MCGVAGLWHREEPGVGLRHRRLSIIDLSTGQLPLCNDGTVWVAFNGEIVNYVERRDELENRDRRRLVLARDRVGIRSPVRSREAA